MFCRHSTRPRLLPLAPVRRSDSPLPLCSEPIHPPGTLEQYLPKEKHLGPVDLTGIEIKPKEETSEEKARKQRAEEKPPLDECLSLYDFEVRPLRGRITFIGFRN